MTANVAEVTHRQQVHTSSNSSYQMNLDAVAHPIPSSSSTQSDRPNPRARADTSSADEKKTEAPPAKKAKKSNQKSGKGKAKEEEEHSQIPNDTSDQPIDLTELSKAKTKKRNKRLQWLRLSKDVRLVCYCIAKLFNSAAIIEVTGYFKKAADDGLPLGPTLREAVLVAILVNRTQLYRIIRPALEALSGEDETITIQASLDGPKELITTENTFRGKLISNLDDKTMCGIVDTIIVFRLADDSISEAHASVSGGTESKLGRLLTEFMRWAALTVGVEEGLRLIIEGFPADTPAFNTERFRRTVLRHQSHKDLVRVKTTKWDTVYTPEILLSMRGGFDSWEGVFRDMSVEIERELAMELANQDANPGHLR